MKFLVDFFPVLLFFIVYKFYTDIPVQVVTSINALSFLSLTAGEPTDAIFLATAAAIVASFAQVSLFWLKHRRFEKMHVISLTLITVFGGATLAFQDPVFIKWKPTILNGLFALAFIASQYIGNKTLAQRMMGHAVSVPATIWRRINLAWGAFFLFSGLVNIYVAYSFSEEIWVNFKLFGLLGLTLIFVFAQAFYLAQFMERGSDQQPN
ncbi:MAG: septation protein A [Gammaproteobacteria bacterium]|nr:septation protein A [Gammaproteobacteria bacterium]